MKAKWILLFLGAVLALLILAGCNLGTPVCPTGSLQAVTLGSPAMWEIVSSLSPTLSWTYPDVTCHPEGYRIELRTGPLFTDDLSGGTGNPSTLWSPGAPLQPGREYEWAVSPINGTTLGPIAGYRYFFTGPMCDTASLHAPALLQPDDGAVITDLDPTLIWLYPDPCLPQGYRVDLSTDPTFTDTSLSGGTGNPSTRWGPGSPLTDCTTYFWRIAPINDTTLGPFSEANSFRTNASGTCAPEATATIHGMLWYDQCPVPLDASPAPSPMPAGCVSDSYGVDADGIHQPGEPFMTGITVNIGPGDCPVGGPLSTVTDGSGNYSFTGLTPGKYCINVNAASFLGPGGVGHWTVIPSGHEGNTYRSVLLGAGEILNDQDFAWYRFTGGPTPTPTPTSAGPTFTPTAVGPTFTPTPVPGLIFIPGINLNCHLGPGLIYDTLDVALKGMSYPIDGRNAQGDWLRIMLSPNKGCWVLTRNGQPSGDVSGVRVLIAPPTPTPTMVVNCANYKDEKSCEAQPACQWKQSSLVTAVTYYCTSK
ncbi:MAG TPA: SdrD B-like domain-containing protein [Anaerolineales bacterium]|nr:SdrD B-like domain-containing protein [Anaerolineales bacterium]